ncbi:hypothetical protein FLO80_21160 [Aquicoccus porphyridii]|uniref:Uncharacterized protein n=1 Tax=Aquicoccus porphyridii TaxID=1852029 RepID=A0A5A9YXH1_9RHOB|nr:hypothetical protein [Aquicoccus porphyridii]KAA0909540.1 hypothetical protein FLO80_21160 [Aquicoccus porphyridii]
MCSKDKNEESVEANIPSLFDSWHNVWRIYLNWFSWHTGLHFLAVGGVFSIDIIRESYLLYASLFMLIFALTAFVASYAMMRYDKKIRCLANISFGKKANPLFGTPVAQVGAFGAMIISFGLVVLWFVLILFSLCGRFAAEV